MPKRRITTSKQRAASKRNLVKARAAKPHGKMVSGYHLTEPGNVKSIVAKGFSKSLSGSKGFKNPVFFFAEPPSAETKKRYAMGAKRLSVVSGEFNFRKAKKLTDGNGPAWYIVESEKVKNIKHIPVGRKVRKQNLAGRRVKRVR